MTLRELFFSLGYKVDNNSENKVEKSIHNLKSLATKALGAIGIGFSITGLANLAQAAADMQATASQFKQVFGDLETEASNSLDKIAKDTGISVNRMKGSFTQIAAFAKTTDMKPDQALALTNRAMRAVADSAAFYDRTLEDTTESLRSFLKGNYENDSALGLSCTETTRNAAAMEEYGKAFKDLSEQQKQFTLLKMVEDANKASGAFEQAQNESDTWTNQLGNLKQSVTDLKAAAGSTFLKPAVAVLKLLTKLVQGATKAVQRLTDENGLLTRATERYHELVKRLQPAIDRMAQTLSKGLMKGIDAAKNVVAKLGGIGNAIKMLSIVVAAFLVVMKWGKIVAGAKAFATVISRIGKMFSLAKLKMLAVVAVIVLLTLVVEDFINFLLGNDSIIGTIFDKAGIGADNVRKAVFNAWGRIKEFLSEALDFMRQAVGMWVDTVQGFFEKHGESIRQNFERVWGIVKTLLQGVWTFLSQLAETLFGSTEDSIDGSTKSTKDNLLSVWKAIMDALSAVWDTLYEAASAVFNAVATVVETVFGWIKTFWDNWGADILAWFKVVWDAAGGILNGFLDVIKGVANFIKSVFTGDWQGAWEAIKQVFSGIWNMIVNYITAVWETIKLLFSMALSAISAIWDAIWGGISSFFMGIWNGIVSFLQGVWNTITSAISGAITGAYNTIVTVLTAIWNFFGTIFTNIASFVSNVFANILSGISGKVGDIRDSIIDGFHEAVEFITGLPEQAIQWGLDFIDGLKSGILSGIEGITEAVKGVGEKIRSFLHFSVPDEGPLTDYESWMPDFMQGMASGIKNNMPLIQQAVQDASAALAKMGNVSVEGKTALNAVGGNTKTNNVSQVNEYHIKVTGTDPQTVNNAANTLRDAGSDNTSSLADALAYGL